MPLLLDTGRHVSRTRFIQQHGEDFPAPHLLKHELRLDEVQRTVRGDPLRVIRLDAL